MMLSIEKLRSKDECMLRLNVIWTVLKVMMMRVIVIVMSRVALTSVIADIGDRRLSVIPANR